jgi:hypothetical protein
LGPILRRVILWLAGAALLAPFVGIGVWRWWFTRGDGQDVVESPTGAYRVLFTARTSWLDVFPTKGVTVDIRHRDDQLVDGLSLYKLHPYDDLRSSTYDRQWVRENVLHLRANEQIAHDCNELVVSNETQDSLRYVVVHTWDIVLVLNLAAGEEVILPISRRLYSNGAFMSASGAFATNRELESRQTYRLPGERGMPRRFVVAVVDEGFELNALPMRRESGKGDCR